MCKCFVLQNFKFMFLLCIMIFLWGQLRQAHVPYSLSDILNSTTLGWMGWLRRSFAGREQECSSGMLVVWQLSFCPSVTEPNLGLLALVQESQSPDTGLWWRKVQRLLQAPSKESRQLVLKRPQLPDGFQGKVFKHRVREGGCGVCDQLVDILLIGWWWGIWESTSSTFWFQLVRGLHAWGSHTVNFFHLVGTSVSAKQLKGHGSEY